MFIELPPFSIAPSTVTPELATEPADPETLTLTPAGRRTGAETARCGTGVPRNARRWPLHVTVPGTCGWELSFTAPPSQR